MVIDSVMRGRPADPPRTDLASLVAALARRAPTVQGERVDDVVVSGITLSTERVRPGDLYAALPGARRHGAEFAGVAAEAGAVAIFTDPAGLQIVRDDGCVLPAVVVERPRELLGELSAQVYGYPAEKLTVIGVTGTQGKTTTTRLLEGALQAAQMTASVVGTIGTRIAGEDIKTALTTPEAPDLHGLFAAMVESGVQICAMEVSSQGLALGRVDGVVFDLAVFTNLGRDHLDFHSDVEDYFGAKAQLFTAQRAKQALICIDDEFGRRLAREASIGVQTYAVGAMADEADWSATDVVAMPAGSDFILRGPEVEMAARSPLPGSFNVANTVAALAACGSVGLDLEPVAQALASGSGVPGRLETVEAGQDFTVVVDYAHKPDAVHAAITALRPLTRGRVIVVIGAGGDRDPGKRPLMGRIAAEQADLLIVTDDNPRTEDPPAIRSAILAGAGEVPTQGRAEIEEIGDRRQAIRRALKVASPGDVVLIAGKGHESGQEVAGTVHPFDDRSVALEELRA